TLGTIVSPPITHPPCQETNRLPGHRGAVWLRAGGLDTKPAARCPMLVQRDCPSCKRTLEFPSDTKARRVRCPACHTIFDLRLEEEPVEAIAADDDAPVRGRRRDGGRAGWVLGLLALAVALPALVLSVIPAVSLLGLACGLPGFLLGLGGLG